MLPRPLQQRIEDKRAELANLTEIKKYTDTLTDQLDQLQDKLADMVDGTESVALVLSTWQNVIRSISLASLGLHKYSQKDYETGTPLPETLVRIKLDKDELSNSSESEDEDEETIPKRS